MNKKHVLILGASGFVGSRLFQLLAQKPDEYRITILVHKSIPKPIPANIRVIQGSLGSFDLSALEKDKPDIIFHLARIHSSRFGRWGRYIAALKGYRANKRLLHYLEKSSWAGSLIYLSGSLMYGTGYADESTPLNPTSFAREYQLAERPFLKKANHNFTVTMVRVPWVFGKGSWLKGFYLDIMKNEKVIPAYSRDDFKMMLIDVEDCAAALLHIATLKHEGALNLFIPETIRYADFISILSEVSGISNIQKFADNELRKDFEKAIYEAFTEEVLLGTKYPQYQLQSHFRYNNPKALVRDRLASFLKNE